MKMKIRSGSTQFDAHSKRSAKDLLMGKKNYANIMDSISDGVYCLNSDGYFIYVNNVILKRSGISKDQFYTSHFLDLVDPEFHRQAKKNFQHVMKGGEGIPYELRYKSFGGQIRIVEVHSKPIYEGERIVGLQGISRDITDSKHLEEQILLANERLHYLLSSTSAVIYTAKPHGDYAATFISENVTQVTGYEPGEYLETSSFWLDHVHPDDVERILAELPLIFERNLHIYEYRFLCKGGRYIWVRDEMKLVRNAIGAPLEIIGYWIDISERKHVEEALRRSEEKYRALLENASDAILLADEQGNLIEANRKVEELFGYPREELLQMHYTQLHPMMELEKTITVFKDIVIHGNGYLQDGAILRKDGRVVPVDITASAIEYGGRRVFQASFRDISEHKRAEDTLEELVKDRTAELSEKNKQLILEIKERKNAEAALRQKKKDLTLHAGELQEMNAALKVLLKQREEDKRELEEKVMANVKELLLPYLEELKTSKLDAKGNVQISILEANLKGIISPFTHKLSSQYSGFTPREIQVANLIRQGKSTKDIAEIVGVSRSAINIYRNHIRNKLGIITKKINLRSHLMSLS